MISNQAWLQDKRDPISREADTKANVFNLKVFGVMCLFVLASFILNELGVFTASKTVMLFTVSVSFFFFLLPSIAVLIHDRALKKTPSLTEFEGLKYLIIVSAFVGIALICVAMSHNVVILNALPALIAAQYRYQKKLMVWIFVATALLVIVGVYGSFFFGSQDRNFIKGMLSDEGAKSLANRIAIATPKRMLELFYHYAMPRLFCALAIVSLVFGVTRRNRSMLNKQRDLSNKINDDMRRMNSMQSHVIDALATLIENRDEGTGDHVQRTKSYVGMICEKLKTDPRFSSELTDEKIRLFERAAPLHDIGKIAVSDVILLKPGKLTPEEFEKMKSHTTKGGSMIGNIFSGIEDSDFVRIAGQIALGHHERWDGGGYPRGLSGEEIPLPARIMAVADVYDALISPRVYKQPIDPEKALGIMESESGTHFDPFIMENVLQMKDALLEAARSKTWEKKD
ncbi:MAG: HD domain-containing protein [Clostridia bacterium]|nr:HD domain-containing protein [Clostridia bacterium]